MKGTKIFKKFKENSCSRNNWRLPGEPRTLDDSFLSSRLFNNKQTYWILPTIWISQMAKGCTFNHWWQSDLGEWKPGFLSQDNSFEAWRWVSLLLVSLGSFQLGHHRIVAYGKQKCSFVPHSHAILRFCACGLFCPFWVLLHAFFINFYLGSSIHSGLLCERCI